MEAFTPQIKEGLKLLLDPFVEFVKTLYPLIAKTHIIKLDFLDSQLEPIAAGLGGLCVLKYTLSLFLAYPFAAILRMIPNSGMKHMFSLLGGFFISQWVFGPMWIHSLISSLGTYIICLISPRKQLPSLVFLWAMGYMTLSHIYPMYTEYMVRDFDYTGMQMVLTMKLTSFAYNLYDGKDSKVINPAAATYKDEKEEKVYRSRQNFAIHSLPNPIEFFGYIYCFTCLLAGPAFEYNDYVRSIDGSAFKGKKTAKDPSSVFPAMKCLMIGVVTLVCHIVLKDVLGLKLSTLHSTTVPIPAYSNNVYVDRYLFLWLALMAERMKYYFAWKVAEGASVLGGFGFQGFNEKGEVKGWSGVENIDIWGFESSTNVQTLSKAWNKRTQGWLQRYTYERSGGSLIYTYFISAFWHGLYPGFFLFFMSVPLMTNIERLIKAKINPLIVPGFDGYNLKTYPKGVVGQIWWLLCWVGNTLGMNYVVQTFSMGSWENCMVALGSFHHVPHFIFFAVYLLLALLPGGSKKKKVDDNNKKKA